MTELKEVPKPLSVADASDDLVEVIRTEVTTMREVQATIRVLQATREAAQQALAQAVATDERAKLEAAGSTPPEQAA